MKARRLNLQFEMNRRRPESVRAVVMELRARASPEDWACLEVLALEVVRCSVVDQESLLAALNLGAEAPAETGK